MASTEQKLPIGMRQFNMWSVLFLTGYLTQQGESQGNIFRPVIPMGICKKQCKVMLSEA